MLYLTKKWPSIFNFSEPNEELAKVILAIWNLYQITDAFWLEYYEYGIEILMQMMNALIKMWLFHDDESWNSFLIIKII